MLFLTLSCLLADEGVSRMQTSLRRRHRDRVVRRGIGMTIESDFYATEAGRAHFSDQLQSIRYCVQETCNFDALYAYLTCGNYDFRYDMQKGLRPRRSVRTAMAHEIMMYGIVQVFEARFKPFVYSPLVQRTLSHMVCFGVRRRMASASTAPSRSARPACRGTASRPTYAACWNRTIPHLWPHSRSKL